MNFNINCNVETWNVLLHLVIPPHFICPPPWGEESIVVHFFCSTSLMLLSLSLHSFLFFFSPFSCCTLSLPTLHFPSLSLYLRLSSPFSTNARDTERALAIKAIMSMFTKALIHQNKERQRERGRRMEDKGRERIRERGRCWSVPLNGFGL